jgi:hypothetical protein
MSKLITAYLLLVCALFVIGGTLAMDIVARKVWVAQNFVVVTYWHLDDGWCYRVPPMPDSVNVDERSE